MSVELRPLGVRCNLACQYCYQQPQRDARNLARDYDLEAMKAAILEEGGPFTLFGGEPLLVPKVDLEALWAWGLERFGQNSVQTNGELIDDEHIALFRRYRVAVGISIDGPGPLNDARWIHSRARTRAATERIEANIDRLCAEGMPPSLIVTLHRMNAEPDKLPEMAAWLERLDRIGVQGVRLHVLESESAEIRQKYGLTSEQNLAALRFFSQLEGRLSRLRFDLFSELRRLLLGDDRSASCVWRACDPYATEAVRGVEGHGERSNCGRTNKDGIDFVKSGAPSYIRYLALYHTPRAHGGCSGCRFFFACKGQCPGTSLGGDFRNRSEHCELWEALFSQVESALLEQGERPVSLQPERAQLERQLLRAWSRAENPTIAALLSTPSDQEASA